MKARGWRGAEDVCGESKSLGKVSIFKEENET